MEFVNEYIAPFIRWVHIVAGITWIGLLYYFNWMNGHITATMDADTKKKVVPELMPRVLYWFRWGAAYTWITGVILLALVFYHFPVMMFKSVDGQPAAWGMEGGIMVLATFLVVFIYDAIFKVIGAKQPVGVVVAFILTCAMICAFEYVGNFTYRAYVISTGAMFGTMMAFNVWFRIWPAQQRIITAVKNGQAPDAADPAMAGLRSKHNTYMSVPLVYTMINQHHETAGSPSVLFLMGAIALGWLVVYMLYKKGATVKGF